MAYGAQARAAFAFHRFSEARYAGQKLLELDPGKNYPFEILGDALLELGDVPQAADVYQKRVQFNNGDDDAATEIRLGRLDFVRGDIASARRRAETAVSLAQAMEPPSPMLLSWSHVQAGELAFRNGDLDTAERHYAAALAANPRDWSASDHLAELRGAQRRFAEGASMYEALVARVPRPELFQALGDLYAMMGKPQVAATWHARARQAYLKAIAAGSGHYYHHLAGFYSDSQRNGAEAVKWAQKDFELRHSVFAYDALAWAYYQNGEFAKAAEAMNKAVSLGTKDFHMLYHASLVFYRAGDAARGRDFLRQAAEANPKFMEFHVHR
jgi:tetratricopeptide (TPR) repeat protein